ncbi:MAG TPA: hypothetical protein PLD99_00415, partial [Parcubacteria group bacterium]|nr:hypothetical protein [Parcubacteria group bacterium]
LTSPPLVGRVGVVGLYFHPHVRHPMPLVTIYVNDQFLEPNVRMALAVRVHREIESIVKKSLDVDTVVVQQISVSHLSSIFIDITCNHRETREANLNERRDMIAEWLRGIMEEAGMRTGVVHLRIVLAPVSYCELVVQA